MMGLILAFTGLANAQQEVVIGNGTNTTGLAPFYGNYNYSYTEMLYGADEIGTAGTITAISFETPGASYTSLSFVLDIYMKNVARTSFASTSDWETSSPSDKVCSTTLSSQTTGWVTFTLDTPFQYDGASTLMIAFDNNTGNYTSKSFKGHEG